MKIDDLLSLYNIKVFEFPTRLWCRKGFYYPENRKIYLNSDLSEDEKKAVILHELGHINHDPKKYKRMLVKYENEADRFMIKSLLKEYLEENDVLDFNWLKFAEKYKISSTWGQEMIQDEFKKLI